MGHGASAVTRVDPVFCCQELVEGNKYMLEDDYFCHAFASFVKNGSWKEHFCKYFRPEEYIVLSLELLGRELVCIVNDYLLPREEIESLKLGSDKHESEKSLPSMRTHSSEDALSKCKVSCFTARELAGILFSALYMMFLATTDCESVCDVRSFGGSTIDDGDRFHFDDFKPTAQLLRPQRSSELIVDAIECFSVRDLLQELQSPTWATDTTATFDESSLCLTVVDTLSPGFPIVYANKAFLGLTGHKAKTVLGSSFNDMSGEDTEESQQALLLEAIGHSKSARIGVTHYTKKRKAFFALVSVKAAGRYAVCNYIATEKPIRVHELKMADDVLCLMTCVIKNPFPIMHQKSSNKHYRAMKQRSVHEPTPLSTVSSEKEDEEEEVSMRSAAA